MGYAIADEFASNGAEVCLVSGPVNIMPKRSEVNVIPVNTAAEMYDAAHARFADSDIIVMAAAVSDFTPGEVLDSKMKRGKENWDLKLKPTSDIAASLGRLKKSNQILVGFALEKDKELENAKRKLNRKNLDLIILNSLRDSGAGFGYDTNKVIIIDKNNNIDNFELKSKVEVAVDIVNKIQEMIKYEKTS